MAWRCSGSTNAELLSNLRSSSLLTSARVFRSMSAVDRAAYVPTSQQAHAYDDAPQSIGYGATISAPHMHAYALEALEPYLTPGVRVLDVGSGSGYLLGVFHALVKGDGDEEPVAGCGAVVVGIDHLSVLVDMARSNLERDGKRELLESGGIELVHGDGRLGYAARGPYSAIHVGAASKGVPEALVSQLKSPGRMFVPVEDETGVQDIWLIDKDQSGSVTREKLYGVRYVPLTDARKQWPGSAR